MFPLRIAVLTLFLLTFTTLYAQNSIIETEVIIGTFLGNWQRNYYGNQAPDHLNLKWKTYLGKGKTIISKKIGEKEWAGTGWTGQPLLIRESGRLYLVLGCFDHNLKKIDAETGEVVWEYRFDDVIKGTATIWENYKAANITHRLVILQGSRRGIANDLNSKIVPSFRAVSYFDGKELWRLNVRRTPSYSRDVDASAIILNDTAYIGLENGIFTVFSPDPRRASYRDAIFQPQIFEEIKLFTKRDSYLHGGNLVTESSPALFGGRIYLTSGSGHVYGYNLKTKSLDWDFYVGSDIDGSPVVTADSCLLVTIEKQYISGQGGVFKLKPAKRPKDSVIWFYPTEDDSLLTWAGGVIGSAGINDCYRAPNDPSLGAFMAIDGNLYVVDHCKINHAAGTIPGPNEQQQYPIAQLIFKYKTGPSIATPVFTRDKLIAAGYHGLFLFEYDKSGNFRLIAHRKSSAFESTPIVHERRIYIGARDGYLYCFGD